MDLREALEICKRLGVPLDLALASPVEVRYAEVVPGLPGKLHVSRILPPDVDRQPVPCGAFFEDAHPDAGPADAERLSALLEEGALCTVCLSKVDVVNVSYFAVVDQVVDTLAQHADLLEQLAAAAGSEPEKLDPLLVGYVASGQQRIGSLIESARSVDGFDAVAERVEADSARARSAFDRLMGALEAAPDLAPEMEELLSAVKADSARYQL